jgi:hypothetical protein
VGGDDAVGDVAAAEALEERDEAVEGAQAADDEGERGEELAFLLGRVGWKEGADAGEVEEEPLIKAPDEVLALGSDGDKGGLKATDLGFIHRDRVLVLG